MSDPKPLRIDLVLALALSMSGITTILLALAFWTGNRTPGDLFRWAALWFFTVAAPGIEARRLHRGLGQVFHAAPDVPERVRRDLARTRSSLLIFGSVTVVMAFALGLGER